jgi:hypothetical protein
VRYEFTLAVARLGAVFGALGILAGCAAREGVLLASWMPPTTNTDGSPLTDLASYRIYFQHGSFPVSWRSLCHGQSYGGRPNS